MIRLFLIRSTTTAHIIFSSVNLENIPLSEIFSPFRSSITNLSFRSSIFLLSQYSLFRYHWSIQHSVLKSNWSIRYSRLGMFCSSRHNIFKICWSSLTHNSIFFLFLYLSSFVVLQVLILPIIIHFDPRSSVE